LSWRSSARQIPEDLRVKSAPLKLDAQCVGASLGLIQCPRNPDFSKLSVRSELKTSKGKNAIETLAISLKYLTPSHVASRAQEGPDEI
jgi:hypothetical protein